MDSNENYFYILNLIKKKSCWMLNQTLNLEICEDDARSIECCVQTKQITLPLLLL